MNLQISMLRFKEAFQYLLKLSERVRRYPNEARADAREGQVYELDNLILTDPNRALSYFRFEYLMCALFSASILISTVWFYLAGPTPPAEHIFLYWWLLVGIFLHSLNILVKSFIIHLLYKIPGTETLIARRLMLLIRSNLFSWNERASFFMYNFYVLGMCKLACNNICGSMRNSLYQFCYFIACSFLLRMSNLFARFLIEYFWRTRNVNFDTVVEKGISAKEIAEIPVEVYHQKGDHVNEEDLENQWCGICLEYFKDGDTVKKFPCYKQHCFHKGCTEIWLRTHNVCPYCRRSLKKTDVKE